MASKTIVLKGGGVRKEAVAAAGTILPGHLIERNTSAQFIIHATAGGNSFPLFAIENDHFGNDITVLYASGDEVMAEALHSGSEVNAVLADSNTIVVNDYLESNGDGTLRKHVAPTESSGNLVVDPVQIAAIVGRALEAVTTSGATARIRVEVR